MKRLIPLIVLGIAGFSSFLAAEPANRSPAPDPLCPAPGLWHDATGQNITSTKVYSDLMAAPVILLGEHHDRMEHHRWQLHVLAGIHAQQPNLVIALEMLPRTAQPVLDAWVQGQLDPLELVEQSNWQQSWGFDAELYMPIFHFARMNRIPMLAINVERSLMRRILMEGWDAIPPSERHGITPPAPASPAYRDHLAKIFLYHPSSESPEAELERFISGQLLWDRAMATGIQAAHSPDRTVVALMGSGHIEFGYGVPHQLADLQLSGTRWIMPWEFAEDCTGPQPEMAHFVFGLEPGRRFEPPTPMQLGVRIESAPENGVRILSVSPDSVAERSGLLAGDVLLQAADQSLSSPGDLIAIVRNQRPGNVVPLLLTRDGQTLEKLARFYRFEQDTQDE